jgi:tetratricopeptide (TPR) repeat protein
MVAGADDLGAWLVGVLADAGRRKLIAVVLGDDLDRALRQAAAAAVRATAREACPGDEDRAGRVAMVVGEVFAAAVPGAVLAGPGTVLEGLQAGIAGQLAVLDDAELTGTGMSSGDVLGVSGGVLAEQLSRHLLAEIAARGVRGGPLFPLAAQLNDDATHVQGRRLEALVGRVGSEILAELGRPAARAVAAPVALAQLPPVTAAFGGREGELGVLAGLLDPAQAGAVTVSAVAGLAGVGKTTLAVAAGHAAVRAGWYRGGVLFIDLHGYDDQPVQPGQALDALLRALGVPAEYIPPGAGERGGLYRSALARISEPVLVIADNAAAEAQVRPLLPGPGPHRVLVTSRHTLAGLGARLVDVTVLDDRAAMAVLDRALRAARPGDDRITGDPGAAGRLAGACGGLPLALEITASILTADPVLSTGELAAELEAGQGRLQRLAYDDGAGPAAPSVAAAFGLSYRKLDDAQARLFRLLSLCPGPDFGTPAAAALAGLAAAGARQLLAGLARAHLIEPAPGAGRWRMHDLLRLYARQQLSGTRDAASDQDRATGRLLAYYLDMAGAADTHLRALPGTPVPAEFAGREEALAWLDAERPALTAAVTLAASTGRDEVAMRLPICLAGYLDWRRRLDDRLATAEAGLAAARRLGHRHGQGDALTSLALALAEVRRFDEAVTAHQEAAAIYRETGDRHGEGMSLGNLGLALVEVQRFDEAVTACRDAAAIFREADDREGEGMSLGNLGLALAEVRRFGEAVTAHQDAAAIFRQTGDRHGEGSSLGNLGHALTEVGRYDEAITACRDAAAIFRQTGDRHGEGMSLGNLGLALAKVRRFGEAITAHRDAAAIFRQTGDRHGEGMSLGNLGLALAKVRRFGEAITTHQEAVAILRETGDQHGAGMALNNLGLALRQVRRFDEASTAYRNAAAIFRETGDRDREAGALKDLGRVQAARDA